MLILLAILFPAIAGVILYIRNVHTQKEGHAQYAVCMLITDALAVLAAVYSGPVTLFRLSHTVTVSFSFDRIGIWFLAAVLFLYTCTLFYAFVYMRIEERDSSFFAFYFISLGALIAVCSADNLVTIYFAFEITTLSTVPLVLHEQTKSAVAAGLKYLFYSIGGALLGLLGVFFVYYHAAEDVSFTPGGVLDPAKTAGMEPVMYVIFFLAIVGYATKAGMYPMHGWLPTAHPIAPAPASALLSGIIAKSGVLVIIRFVFYSVGADFLRGTWVQTAWMCLAVLTIFMGSMMAFREPVLKKRLAYSTISQISYVLLGLSFLTDDGLGGSLLQVMAHASAKACLFLCAGAFIYRYGIRDVHQLRGIGRTMPVVLWCLTIAAMSLVGIPPVGGFTAKWHLALAALNSGTGVFSVLAPVILLVSALLTAGYLLPIMIDGFFPGEEEAAVDVEGDVELDIDNDEHLSIDATPRMMWIPLICLCAGSLAVGLFGNTILSFFGGIV